MPARKGKLSRSEAIGELHALWRKLRRPVRSYDIHCKDRMALYRALIHHFGSIEAARRAARIPSLPTQRKWTDERIIQELRRLHRRGLRITVRNLQDHDQHALLSAIALYMGGIRGARRRAGIAEPYTKRASPEPWDEERVVHEILERHEEGEPLASSKVPPTLQSAGIRYFGSWRQAIEAAGFDYEKVRLRRDKYTEQDLLEMIRKLAKKRPNMNVGQFRQYSWRKAVDETFGSLEKAARRAGVEGWPIRLHSAALSRSEMLTALRRRRRQGRSIFEAAVGRDDPRLARAVQKHYRYWEEAISAAGLSNDSPRTQWTKTKVIKTLKARKAKGVPNHSSVIQREIPGLYGAICRIFGTWEVVAKMFKIEPLVEYWSKAKIIDQLRELGRGGRPVTRARMTTKLDNACRIYFGSLGQAREAAGVQGVPRELWTPERVLKGVRRHSRLPGALPGSLFHACVRYFGSATAARRAAGVSTARAKRRIAGNAP